jgi:hypothetical protein
MDRFRLSTMRRPKRRRGLPGLSNLPRQALINILAALFGLCLLAYLALGYWFWLVPLLLVAGLGVDQILRTHPGAAFHGLADTAMYLFVPVLFALAAAVFFHHISAGLWNVPAAVGSALLFAWAVNAEYLTVEVSAQTYPLARLALSVVSHLTAFALFVVVSTSGLALAPALLAVALVTLLLTVDMLRELEISNTALFAYAAAAAAVTAEVRWAAYFLALPDFFAGGLLLIVFYELNGLLQSYLSGQLDRRAMSEFGGVGSAAGAIIAVFSAVVRNR